jgi:hypothetical protein
MGIAPLPSRAELEAKTVEQLEMMLHLQLRQAEQSSRQAHHHSGLSTRAMEIANRVQTILADKKAV